MEDVSVFGYQIITRFFGIIHCSSLNGHVFYFRNNLSFLQALWITKKLDILALCSDYF